MVARGTSYRDLEEPCAFELVGHQTCSNFILSRIFWYFGPLTLHGCMANSQQDIKQLLTCDTVTESWQIWRRKKIAAAARRFQASNNAANI